MKKRILIVSVAILFIFIGIIGLSYNSNNKNTFTQDGVTYALTLDGTSINTFPSKGMYRADVTCEGATGKWLYDEWKFAIEDIASNNITCDVAFNTIEKTNLNNYIINLSDTTQGNGQVVNENGYRYEGKNPNNYIWFNNELWRIIGVFDSATHGQSGQNLVKIIRANSIGGLAWDKSNTNDWKNSSLKKLLNGAYYNAKDGTGDYCYMYSDTIPGNCDYTEMGINDTYRPMIENVIWYLGGHYGRNPIDAYKYERGTDVYSGRPTSDTGYIGLMYASDYGYSVLSSSCDRTITMQNYSVECVSQSWLYGQGSDEWTITPYSEASYLLLVIDTDGTTSHHAGSGYGAKYTRSVRPTLYLKSDVYVLDGDGSITDPYIIGM